MTTEIILEQQSVGSEIQDQSFDYSCLSECTWNVRPGKECEGSRSENKVYIFRVSWPSPLLSSRAHWETALPPHNLNQLFYHNLPQCGLVTFTLPDRINVKCLLSTGSLPAFMVSQEVIN